MEGFKAFQYLKAVFASLLIFLVISVNAQIGTPCTSSMITSFTPCINYITGSTSNGTTPTAGCCDSIRSLMSGSRDCTCLLITGNVPLSLPINRTLAISLPRACNSGGVPIQCKASGVPLPAPGPVLFGPTPPPAALAPFSPRASKAAALAPSPAETTGEITPASPPVTPIAPTANPGIRPVLNPPTASNPSHISPPFPLLLVFVGLFVFKDY